MNCSGKMNLTVTCHISKASAGTFSLSSRKGRKDVNLAALQEWSLRPVLTSKLNLCACFLPYRCPLSLLKKLFIWPKASLTTDPWCRSQPHQLPGLHPCPSSAGGPGCFRVRLSGCWSQPGTSAPQGWKQSHALHWIVLTPHVFFLFFSP